MTSSSSSVNKSWEVDVESFSLLSTEVPFPAPKGISELIFLDFFALLDGVCTSLKTISVCSSMLSSFIRLLALLGCGSLQACLSSSVSEELRRPTRSSALPSPARRPTILLDGAPWNLQLDPNDPQTMALKNKGAKTAGPITVPGSWQSAGFGAPTERVFHQYIGAANYTLAQEVELPSPSYTYWLLIQHAEKAVRVFCNGREIAFLRGFLDTLEVDAAPCLGDIGGGPVGGEVDHPVVQPLRPLALDSSDESSPNHIKAAALHNRKRLSLTLEVNSTRDPTDALSGEEEVNAKPDALGLDGWGGLGGHVWIEARKEMWMADPFVRPRLEPVPNNNPEEVRSRSFTRVLVHLYPHRTRTSWVKQQVQINMLKSLTMTTRRCIVPCSSFVLLVVL